MFEIVIDTGGTFTDAVLTDEDRKIRAVKFPTNVVDPSMGIMGCIGLLSQQCNLTEQELLKNVATLVVGTTLATNALLEGKVAKCGLIHTKGFRDTIELGRRMVRKNVFNIKVHPPSVLIPRSLRWGVEERTLHTGEILTPLNEDDVRAAIKKAKEQNVEIPVVAFLHSYANPENEERAAEIIRTEYPNVVVSSHILRRWIEFDRLSAATIAACVKPQIVDFTTGLQKRLKDNHFNGALLFLTCLGGVASTELSGENPALLIGSGPAAAVLLGKLIAESSGFQNVIVGDMGGTSFDVGILPDRMITTTTESLIGEYKNAVEGIEVKSIGAGGGSIARVDERGVLRVGPSSAGANPGPACYGRGGQLPTVTDADVVLGYVPPDYFLGGTYQLDAAFAEKAIDKEIAKPLRIDVVEAAYAISSLAEANMANRIFLSAVEKGLDPRDFTLIIGGGAGPVHAVALAGKLDMKQVYISKYASTFSALGIMIADYKHILTRFLYKIEDEADFKTLKKLYDSLEEEGIAHLRRENISKKAMKFIRGAEMRYYGQLHDIEVLLPETKLGEHFTEKNRTALIKGFHERHKALYGSSDPNLTVTFATLKLQAIGMRPPFNLVKQKAAGRDASGAIKRKRQVYFKEAGKFVKTPCYDGNRLRYGNVITAPAIIEEANTTVVVPPGTKLTVDVYGNYVIAR
jgi:N-methylhydantoinase A